MKKESIITAVVFLVVGFLAGYITHAQLNSGVQPRTARPGQGLDAEVPGRGGAASAASEANPPGLPEGHLPINIATQVRALEDQAAQNPTDPKPRLELANFLYDNRRYEGAIEWYQRALELDPRNVNARTDMGTAYFYSGRVQDALREYHKSLETDANHGPTLYNLTIVHLDGTHDLAAAQDAWERLRKQNPNYPGLDDLKQKLDVARASSAGAPARR